MRKADGKGVPVKRLILLLALIVAACGAGASTPTVMEGDILFQTSLSSQSRAIQLATGSKYSHMGLIILRNGKPYVFEAEATTRYTPLSRWIARGSGHHYVVKRLVDADRTLTADALQRLESSAKHFEGRPYDAVFEWSDDRMYCSELVWKAYKNALGLEIGSLQHIRDFNLSNPIVQSKMRERYGDHIPLDEPVISPAAMFQSPLLVTVARD